MPKQQKVLCAWIHLELTFAVQPTCHRQKCTPQSVTQSHSASGNRMSTKLRFAIVVRSVRKRLFCIHFVFFFFFILFSGSCYCSQPMAVRPRWCWTWLLMLLLVLVLVAAASFILRIARRLFFDRLAMLAHSRFIYYARKIKQNDLIKLINTWRFFAASLFDFVWKYFAYFI